MHIHHPRFLPPAFSDFEVESGGIGAGTLTLQPSGCVAQIASRWDGASGIGGFFERLFAPRVLRGIYADELGRLDAYAQAQSEGVG
jgi:hypothetical protein